MSTFRPISPSLNQPLSVSVMEFEESEPVNPLIKWVFAVHNNAFSATSENITNLKGLSETFPSRTFEALSPNKYSDLIAKIQAIFTSLCALTHSNTNDSSILQKASVAVTALKEAFPQAVRMETPPVRTYFSFSPVVTSITPTKLEPLFE